MVLDQNPGKMTTYVLRTLLPINRFCLPYWTSGRQDLWYSHALLFRSELQSLTFFEEPPDATWERSPVVPVNGLLSQISA